MMRSEAISRNKEKDYVNRRDEIRGFLRKGLFLVIILLSIIILLELLFHFFLAPNLRINRIELYSDLGLEKEEILEFCGIKDGLHFYDLDTSVIEQQLHSLPMVKTVRIEKHFPDTLLIRIQKRKALVSGIIDRKGQSLPVLFDEEGVLFRMGKDIDTLNLPVLSGISLEKAQPGARLPSALRPLLLELAEIRSNKPALLKTISEIEIERLGDLHFETLLYPVHLPVKVRVGRMISASMLEHVLIVLEALEEKNMVRSVAEIDFRSKEITYIMRGE